MGPQQVREVTGVVLTRDGVALSREYLNGARGFFHSALMRPEEFRPKFRKLQGTLELIKQVNGRGSAPVIFLGEKALNAIRVSEVRPDGPGSVPTADYEEETEEEVGDGEDVDEEDDEEGEIEGE
jgi:hypothetical protein